MPLQEFDVCFRVFNQRIKPYIVTKVVKVGKSPRYELDGHNGKKLELLMAEEEAWMNKTIFVDRAQADVALEQQIEENVEKWSKEMFQGKEHLARLLFDCWLQDDNMLTVETDLTTQDRRQRKRKAELMIEHFKKYFDIEVQMPFELREE